MNVDWQPLFLYCGQSVLIIVWALASMKSIIKRISFWNYLSRESGQAAKNPLCQFALALPLTKHVSKAFTLVFQHQEHQGSLKMQVYLFLLDLWCRLQMWTHNPNQPRKVTWNLVVYGCKKWMLTSDSQQFLMLEQPSITKWAERLTMVSTDAHIQLLIHVSSTIMSFL